MRTFSSAVRYGKTALIWNERTSPLRATSACKCGSAGKVRSGRCVASFAADFTGATQMTTSIRSFCLAALLAAGSAWAQQQPADNPDNPHSTQAKDKQGADVSTSTTHQQIDQAEKPNPDSPQNKDRDRVGSAGMDHDAMMQNATPQMILQKLHMANLEEIEMGKLAEH